MPERNRIVASVPFRYALVIVSTRLIENGESLAFGRAVAACGLTQLFYVLAQCIDLVGEVQQILAGRHAERIQ